jgi:Lysylphosphatidylglycerol synthase TM region
VRRVALWVGSVVASIVMLWVARAQFGVQLVPEDVAIVDVSALVVACLLHVPYAVLRAMRLQVGLDPLVAAASPGDRFDRRALLGSGFVSFLVLLVLPFKLGEASRPILLARAEQPGVGVAEAVGVVGLERVIDGVLICAMLFGGLALAHADLVGAPEQLVLVQRFGQWMGVAFVAALGFALLAAREPAAWGARITRWLAWQPRLSKWAGAVVVRVAESFAALLGARRLGVLVVISLAYWAVTVAQLGAVARACGVDLSWAAAAATVAIIGLSIQLPGGPAQTGTFQVGAGAAMALFVRDADALDGAARLAHAAHVNGFVATMFALPLLGAVAMALPGLWLLARARAARTAGRR